ncbi:MAG: hypothetical protein KGP12_12490 [Actinomycetales bacterium]|nr:hypothetical protein [Actinomycetales bacterium]
MPAWSRHRVPRRHDSSGLLSLAAEACGVDIADVVRTLVVRRSQDDDVLVTGAR